MRAFTRPAHPQSSLGVSFLLIAVAVAVSMHPAGLVWAETIVLISGNGPIGSEDPANEFTLDGMTWEPAFIVAPLPDYAVIPDTQYINRNPDTSGLPDTTTRYRTSFALPSGFGSPSLTLQIHADNVATIFLNGVQIGQQPFGELMPNFEDPPEMFTVTDPSLFLVGMNSLEFDITNFCCSTAFDYKATVSFTTETTGATLCSNLGLAGRQLDRDVFRFDGTAGEEIVLRLDNDPAGTHTGNQAILSVEDIIRGVTFSMTDSGPLPRTIAATLPATGRYLVPVVELPPTVLDRFRGAYCLNLQSSGEAQDTLAPHAGIE